MSYWADIATDLAGQWQLSQRESELLRRGITGTCRSDLAVEMGISDKTIQKHVQALLKKAHTHGYDGERFERLIADIVRRHTPM